MVPKGCTPDYLQKFIAIESSKEIYNWEKPRIKRINKTGKLEILSKFGGHSRIFF
jgi:hypothetical protein